jgi:EF hand domain-containing protein
MLFALGAASSAIDTLKRLISSNSASTQSTGLAQNTVSPFDTSASTATATSAGPNAPLAGSGASRIAPETMGALLDAQSQSSTGSTASASASPSAALKDLFSQIDADGDGKITKSEFENALGAGGTNLAQADDVFSKLDKDSDGSVSVNEMSSALKGAGGKGGGHHRHHHVASSDGSGDSSGSNGSSSDPLMQALDGATSTAVTNSDGSTTTTLTYADGSKVTVTSAAQTSNSSAATSSYNFIEQMIQRQANAISTSATASLSVSA